MSGDYREAYLREKTSRQLAEQLLEDKSREMFLANQKLEQFNAELVEKQRALAQSEKMASIGILAAGVAHEINNPIGFCLSNVDVLRDYLQRVTQGGTPAELEFVLQDSAALIDETMDGLQRVADIVRDMQGFARKNNELKNDVDVNRAISSTLKMLNHRLKYVNSLNLLLSEIPLISTNESKLQQVLLNIIMNAAQAVEDDSEINILTERVGDFVLIRVKDNGTGISEENLDKIFTPFFTTKTIGEGTGLGLSVTYSLVRELGGDIQVSSEPGRGTEFSISLPINHQRSDSAASGLSPAVGISIRTAAAAD